MTSRQILGTLLILILAAGATAAPGDARIVSGRPAPTVERDDGPSRWSLHVGAGLAAGGDLFRVQVDDSRAFTTPLGGAGFNAQRFTTTLDEQALLSGDLIWRTGETSALRLGFSWAEMDVAALANDGQYVTPILWDQASLTTVGLVWEQTLLQAPLRPYLLAGAVFLSVDALAPELDQEAVAPLVGVGVAYRVAETMQLHLSVRDVVRQLDTEGVVGASVPANVEYASRGPQHLIGLSGGLELSF